MSSAAAVLGGPLTSPAHLGRATESWWRTPPHVLRINDALQDLYSWKFKRLSINLPAQHFKSTLTTNYFPAWALMLDPELRIMIVGHEFQFACTRYGMVIKDIFEKWKGHYGYEFKEDMRTKGMWGVEGHGGYVVCRGWQGGVAGWPADLFIIDDLIKDETQSLSKGVLERQRGFYETVVFGRVQRRRSRLVIVGTRWSKNDLFGHIERSASRTGEEWKRLVFPAIAKKKDLLGRKEGEALDPENVPLEVLLRHRQSNPTRFAAGWQQEPQSEETSYFQPSTWPLYADIGGAFSVGGGPGEGRRLYGYQDVLRFMVVDWATSTSKRADYTAIGLFGLLPDGRILVLNMRNERIKVERVVGVLAEECRRWQPWTVVVESGGFQGALAAECRRYPEIPEVRQVTTKGMNKVQRALPAIVYGQNGRILLPDPAVCSAPRTIVADEVPYGWLDDYRAQLADFTGLDDNDHDDMVDVTAYAAQQAQQLRGGYRSLEEGNMPCMLTAGKDPGGWPG